MDQERPRPKIEKLVKKVRPNTELDHKNAKA
jgi:hypothetical protein